MPVGAAVTWTNRDNFTHSVKFADRPDHVLRPGETVTVRFDRPGTYPYVCTFHAQNMQGRVIVTGGP